jgi:hypothetical protein
MKMSFRAAIAATSFGLLLLTTSACSKGSAPDAIPGHEEYPPIEADIVRGTASWAIGYGSLEQLVAGSDLVATGTIIGARPFRSDAGIQTAYTFQTDFVAKGSSSESRAITVTQTGGVIDGKGEEIEDDPLMRTGDRLLLFLIAAPDGSYYVAGGPQGRLVISATNRVRTLRDEYPDRGSSVVVSGVTDRELPEALADIERFKDLPRPTIPVGNGARP